MQALQTETRQRQRKLVVRPRAPKNLNITPSIFAFLLKDGRVECSRPRDRLLLTRSALQAPMSLLNSRSRSFVPHTSGPQTPNLDHARERAIRRTVPLRTTCVIAEVGRYVCRKQSTQRSSED
jgi:hypothetical protein